MSGLIVHEWIAPKGGSENVAEALLEAFPDADLWTLWNDNPSRFPNARESWIAQTPLRRSRMAALPVMPIAWRTLRTSVPYRWMLASSHLFAHHAKIWQKTEVTKLAYVHTPARYVWNPEIDERGRGLAAKMVAPALRSLDRHRASELQFVAANSEYVRARIQKAWNLDATVIYPPVDVERIAAVRGWRSELDSAEESIMKSLPAEFLLGASRFVPYKRLDSVVSVGERLGLPVVLAGSGPDEPRLRELARESSVPVSIVVAPSDRLLFALYEHALAYIFLAIEDFGIMPVEAMACGTPVIVGPHGGALESVSRCRGGPILEGLGRASVARAMELAEKVDKEDLRARALSFSRGRFIAEVRSWVDTSVNSR